MWPDDITENDVRNVVSNPAYAGVGPYEGMVSEDTWLDTAVIRAEKEGIEESVEQTIRMLNNSTPDEYQFNSEEYVEIGKQDDPRKAFYYILADANDTLPSRLK